MTTREICAECEEESAVGFQVPDEIWQAIPSSEGVKLCLRCFVPIADVLELEWDRDIEFFAVSRVTQLQEERRP